MLKGSIAIKALWKEKRLTRKRFLSLRSPSSSYDFSKVIPILDLIYAECVLMSVATT